MAHNQGAHSVAGSVSAETVDDRSFKIRDASSYDSVVDEFDRFTRLLTTPLAERLVSLARPASGERILDIGTGTGVVALESARHVGSNGKVVGIDLSEGMLATAATKAESAGLTARLDFHKMDAEALDIGDRSFDAVVSLFALLHFPDPVSALREMFRVLRPGGRLAVGIGSGAPLLSITGLIHRAKSVSDIFEGLRGKQLTAPGFLNGLVEKHFPDSRDAEETSLARSAQVRAGAVIALVRRAGFEGVSSYWQGHRAILETAEEYWEIQRTFSSVARKRLADADPQQLGALKQEFLETSIRVQSRGGRLAYPIAAFYVIASRPA